MTKIDDTGQGSEDQTPGAIPLIYPPPKKRQARFQWFMVNVYFHQYIHNNIQFKRRCRYEYEYLLLQCEPSAFNNIRSRVIPWSAGQLSYLRQVPEVPGFPRSAPQIRQVAGGEKRSEMDPLSARG